MPGKRLASAAKRVLLLDGPDMWFEIFRHIHGVRILLNLRLVCKSWAHRMLFLRKNQYVMFTKGTGKQLICESIFPLIIYLRDEWAKSSRGEKQITEHIIHLADKSLSWPNPRKFLPRYAKIELKS